MTDKDKNGRSLLEVTLEIKHLSEECWWRETMGRQERRKRKEVTGQLS